MTMEITDYEFIYPKEEDEYKIFIDRGEELEVNLTVKNVSGEAREIHGRIEVNGTVKDEDFDVLDDDESKEFELSWEPESKYVGEYSVCDFDRYPEHIQVYGYNEQDDDYESVEKQEWELIVGFEEKLNISTIGDGYTIPDEGEHIYITGEEVTLESFVEEPPTPTHIKNRLIETLPNFYDKEMKKSKFNKWEEFDFDNREWTILSENDEYVITMNEDRRIRANFTNMRSNFNALMESLGDEIQYLMETYEDILKAHFVDEAEGVHLDEIGQMWGILRIPDEKDESYRERIKAYAPGFGGGGTLDDLKSTLRWYAGEDNFWLEEFSEDVNIENRFEIADAGEGETWDTDDEIRFHFKEENVDSVVDVRNKKEEEPVSYTIDNGKIIIGEDTDSRLLYVEYNMEDGIEQHGRFKVFIDPTGDIPVSIDRILFELDKYKAGGIIIEFGALDFPELDETIRMGEDDKIEGHMVGYSEEGIGGTYVNDGNVVLESDWNVWR